ncbi:MAG TPA: serine protease, partial [Actinomycetota bacterium]|nr:serine protease [Actinomycetota bacterium]
VQGSDMFGNRTSGSGFVLNSTDAQSWVLTSFQLVAGTVASAQGLPLGVTGTPTSSGAPPTGPPPSPVATVHIAGADHTGNVYSWDTTRNLALIVVSVGKVPSLQFSNVVPTAGLTVWAIAASGGPYGATAASGQVTTANSALVSTNAAVGMPATGGPLVDQEGKVVGVVAVPLPSPPPSSQPGPTSTAKSASPSPSPSPAAPVTPALTPAPAIPVRLACIQVVICPRT